MKCPPSHTVHTQTHTLTQMFVLDEADEMLSRGFKDQIYDIFQLLPPKLQVRFAYGMAEYGKGQGSGE